MDVLELKAIDTGAPARMTEPDLPRVLQRTAALLALASEQYPTHEEEMRSLAARLQVLSSDLDARLPPLVLE